MSDFFFFSETRSTEFHTFPRPAAFPIRALVKVVGHKPQPPLRRAVEPEVRHVRVPAHLHVQTRPGRLGEVGRHDAGGAAVEAELVLEHASRSEEHTSELQSRQYLVCRLLLEKKKHNILY